MAGVNNPVYWLPNRLSPPLAGFVKAAVDNRKQALPKWNFWLKVYF